MEEKYNEIYWKNCDERYLSTFRDYIIHYPKSVDDILEWRPRGDHDIELKMKDGSRILYDHIKCGIRYITSDSDHKIYENEDEYRRELASTIRKKIKDAAFTQSAFSEACGINLMTLRRYINGTSMPNPLAIKKMASVLGCSVLDFIDIE